MQITTSQREFLLLCSNRLGSNQALVMGGRVALKSGAKGVAAVAITAMMALSGCEKGGPAPISTGERYLASTSSDAGYLLGADDKIRVTVFGEPQLSGEYPVDGNGTVSLPLIGNVTVVGKTTGQTSHDIEAMLSTGYLRHPRVSVEIATYRPFFILGEVKSPGQYPYTNGLTVTNAIATAQGYTPRARRKYVLIRRFGEEVEQEYVLTPDLRVHPGDTIRLSERYF